MGKYINTRTEDAILTPFKMCCLENFPFIEEDFDALTNYELYCKIVEYLNKVIEQTNINTTEVDDLKRKFIELQQYVNDFFSDLNLQNEVNNKLDSMVSDGTFDEIVKPILETYLVDINKKITENTNKINNNIKKLTNEQINAPKLKIIAHKGASKDAPENSTKAFEIAGLLGYYGIETDIQITKDKKFICLHDGSVDRTTNGTGSTKDLTLAEIKNLTIDVGPDIDVYNDLKIPTLEEYLTICRIYNKVPVIELKYIDTTDIPSFYDILVKYGYVNNCIVISFSKPLLETLRKIDNNIKLLNVIQYYSEDAVNFCLAYNCGLDISDISNSQIIELHKLGLEVGKWTIESTTTIDSIVDYITTDSIHFILEEGHTDYPKEISKIGAPLRKVGTIATDKFSCILGSFNIIARATIQEMLNDELLQTQVNRMIIDRLIPVTSINCKYVANSKYKFTLCCFNENGLTTGDLGWFDNSGSKTLPAGTKYCIPYATNNKSYITYNDMMNILAIINTVRFE